MISHLRCGADYLPNVHTATRWTYDPTHHVAFYLVTVRFCHHYILPVIVTLPSTFVRSTFTFVTTRTTTHHRALPHAPAFYAAHLYLISRAFGLFPLLLRYGSLHAHARTLHLLLAPHAPLRHSYTLPGRCEFLPHTDRFTSLPPALLVAGYLWTFLPAPLPVYLYSPLLPRLRTAHTCPLTRLPATGTYTCDTYTTAYSCPSLYATHTFWVHHIPPSYGLLPWLPCLPPAARVIPSPGCTPRCLFLLPHSFARHYLRTTPTFRTHAHACYTTACIPARRAAHTVPHYTHTRLHC